MRRGCAPAPRRWRPASGLGRCSSTTAGAAGAVRGIGAELVQRLLLRRRGVARDGAALRRADAERASIPKWILFLVNGTLILVALAALLSIWLGPYGNR